MKNSNKSTLNSSPFGRPFNSDHQKSEPQRKKKRAYISSYIYLITDLGVRNNDTWSITIIMADIFIIVFHFHYVPKIEYYVQYFRWKNH